MPFLPVDPHALAGVVAGGLALLSMIPYVVSIVRGETRPSLTTWAIWTVAGSMVAATYLASGATHTWWLAAAYVINPLVVTLLSIRYGVRASEPLDWICLGGALSSLVPWLVYKSPAVALYINILVDLLGALPTFKKSVLMPESENRLSWLMTFVAAGFNILAVERWEPEIFVYPVYAFITTGMIWGALAVRRPAHAA